jgi:pre-mRNA-processing factor SLU7
MDFAKVEKRVRTTGGGSTGTVRYAIIRDNNSVSLLVQACQGAETVNTNVDLIALYRNLRIREDTAKYLLNLDVNSAYYDPKTRSMREDPLPDADPNDKFYVVSKDNIQVK